VSRKRERKKKGTRICSFLILTGEAFTYWERKGADELSASSGPDRGEKKERGGDSISLFETLEREN